MIRSSVLRSTAVFFLVCTLAENIEILEPTDTKAPYVADQTGRGNVPVILAVTTDHSHDHYSVCLEYDGGSPDCHSLEHLEALQIVNVLTGERHLSVSLVNATSGQELSLHQTKFKMSGNSLDITSARSLGGGAP